MPTLPALSRRTALGAALLGTVTGCSLGSLDPSSDDPTITPTSTGGPATSAAPAEPEDDAGDDASLVAEVLAAIALAHRTARANARVHPDLAPVLRPLEQLNARHGAELGTLPATTGRVTAPGESPEQVRQRVDTAELVLQRQLVAATGRAVSGPLALTFASMAGGVLQLRSTL